MSLSARASGARLLGAGLLAASAVASAEFPPLADSEIERLLRAGRVVAVEEVGAGVTNPRRLTLADGRQTIQALWKTIDEYAPVKEFHDGRPPELGFRDSWKHEIAAYELDRLLGTELVPPTVSRRVDGVEGAAQLWIQDAMTETERRRQGLLPNDREAWSRQIYAVRLLRQLTHDTDYNNTGNLLVADGFRLWTIDYSRAFKTRKRLLAPDDLRRFPSAALERLRRLDAAQLEAAVGEWLTVRQRAALLRRRDLIVERADRLIAERGPAAVLLP